MNDIVRAKRPVRLPVVLTREEVRLLPEQLERPVQIMAFIMCGAVLRLMEILPLQIQVLDLGAGVVEPISG